MLKFLQIAHYSNRKVDIIDLYLGHLLNLLKLNFYGGMKNYRKYEENSAIPIEILTKVISIFYYNSSNIKLSNMKTLLRIQYFVNNFKFDILCKLS